MLILIPAAGASARMRGRDKLLEEVDGQPLLARQVGIALAAGGDVLVTLPPGARARRAALDGLAGDRLALIEVTDAAEGMAASLRAGAEVAARRDAPALMVLLGDLPEIEAEDLRAMIARFDGRILRATDETGKAGHPVILPARCYPAMAQLTGDQGAKSVLQGEEIVPFPLPGQRATTDLDTPEAWAAWRARKGL